MDKQHIVTTGKRLTKGKITQKHTASGIRWWAPIQLLLRPLAARHERTGTRVACYSWPYVAVIVWISAVRRMCKAGLDVWDQRRIRTRLTTQQAIGIPILNSKFVTLSIFSPWIAASARPLSTCRDTKSVIPPAFFINLEFPLLRPSTLHHNGFKKSCQSIILTLISIGSGLGPLSGSFLYRKVPGRNKVLSSDNFLLWRISGVT